MGRDSSAKSFLQRKIANSKGAYNPRTGKLKKDEEPYIPKQREAKEAAKIASPSRLEVVKDTGTRKIPQQLKMLQTAREAAKVNVPRINTSDSFLINAENPFTRAKARAQDLTKSTASDEKTRLYETNDRFLSDAEILKKYDYVAKDTNLDYGTLKRAVEKGLSETGRIRNKNVNLNYGTLKESIEESLNVLYGNRDKQLLSSVRGDAEKANMVSSAAKLQNDLSQRLRSTAFGAGFGQAAGLDIYDAAAKKLTEKAGFTSSAEKFKENEVLKKSLEGRYPKSYAAGEFSGELTQQGILYGTMGAAAEKGILKGIGKLNGGKELGRGGRFAANILGNQATDTVVNTPLTIAAGLADGKTKEEISKDIGKQMAMDAAFNVGLGALEGGYKYLKTARQGKIAKGLQSEREYAFTEAAERAAKRLQAKYGVPTWLGNDTGARQQAYMLPRAGETTLKPSELPLRPDVDYRAYNSKQILQKKADTEAAMRAKKAAATEKGSTKPLLLENRRRFVTTKDGIVEVDLNAMQDGKLKEAAVAAGKAQNEILLRKLQQEAAARTGEIQLPRYSLNNEYTNILPQAKRNGNITVMHSVPVWTGNNADVKRILQKKTNEKSSNFLPRAGSVNQEERVLASAAVKTTPVPPEAKIPSNAVQTSAADRLNTKEQQMQDAAQTMLQVRDSHIKKMNSKELEALRRERDQLQDSNYIMEQAGKIEAAGGSTSEVTAEVNRLKARKIEIDKILAQQETFRTEWDITNDTTDELLQLFGLRTGTQKYGISKELKATLQKAISDGEVSDTERERLFQMLYKRGSYGIDSTDKLRGKLKNKHIKIGVEAAADISDFNSRNRDLKGKLGKVTAGRESNIEAFYAELSKEYPGYFPKGIEDPAQMLLQIQRVAEVLASGGKLTEGDYRKQFDRILGDMFDAAGVRQAYREVLKDELNPNRKIDFGSVSTDEVQEWYDEVYRLEQLLKQNGVPETEFSPREQELLAQLLNGELSENAAEERLGPRFALIKKQYDLQKPLKEMQERIEGYRNYVHKQRHDEAEAAVGEIHIKTGDEPGWHDKGVALLYARETQERNLRDIAPDKKTAKQIEEWALAPVHENERQRILMIEEYRDRLREVGISTKKNLKIPIEEIGLKKCSESTLVQYLGERRFDLQRMKEKGLNDAERKALDARMQASGQKLTPDEEWKALETHLQEIEAQLTPEQLERINRGIVTLQGIYKELHPTINYVLIQNGMDPIGYIEGYFPHMFFDDPTDKVGQAFKALGFDLTSRELPMDIAGRTDTFRPGKQWSGNFLKREGTATDYDAIRGFDQYIETVSNVIWHTDDIQRLRALEEHFRYSLSDEGIKEQIKEIRNSKRLSMEEKQDKIDKLYKDNAENHKLQNYVNNLRLYTDLLAGKKHSLDRAFETSLLGRKFYKAAGEFENHVSSNMIGLNFGSALTNGIPVMQGMSNMSVDSNLRGLKEALVRASQSGMDELTKKSAFLATRKGSDALYKTVLQKAGDKTFWLMELADTFSTQAVWRSRYYDNLRNGLNEDTAIKEADSFCRGLFGGRSKGAMPTIFLAKNPIVKPLTMFQLEANGFFSYMMKDIPENAQGDMKKIIRAWLGVLIGGYIYNDFYEKLTGRRPAIDPFGIANETAGDLTGKKLRNLLDVAGDIYDGGDVRFTERTEKKTGAEIYDGLKENITNNIPFVGGLMDGGRIPLSSAFPDFDAIAQAEASYKTGDMTKEKKNQIVRKELWKAGAAMIPPAGGTQLKKTIEGLWMMKDGGNYNQTNKGQELQFAVDQDSPAKWIQAAAFGKWVVPEAREYLEKNNRLGVKQTETYEALVAAGVKNIHAFDTINRIRQEEKAAKKRSLIRGSLLNGEQKAILYRDFMTDEDSTDAEILETFTGTDQIGEVVDCLSWIAEYDSSIPKRSSIANSGLSDWAKEYIYLQKLADDREKEQKRIDAFKNAGMKIDDFLRIKNKFSQINDSVENDQKYRTMKQWMKEEGYSQQQWNVVNDAIGFWITIRLNQKKAEKTRW